MLNYQSPPQLHFAEGCFLSLIASVIKADTITTAANGDFATNDGNAYDMTDTLFQTGTLNILNAGDYEGSALSWDETSNSYVRNHI